jgi:hypothetical protein
MELGDLECVKNVGDKVTDLNRKVEESELVIKKLEDDYLGAAFGVKIKNISSPYNELFADTVAVLYTNDLDSMSDNFEFEGMSESEDIVNSLSRSFTVHHDVETWNEDKITHYVLAPTRSYIGKLISPSSMSLADKKALLSSILDSSIEAMSERWDKQKELTVQEINKDLIERLRSRLEK